MTIPTRSPSKLERIDASLIAKYKRREITSFELASATGMNASYLRRAIDRDPVQPRPNKGALIAARKAYRLSIAHLDAAEIANMAHVSLRTAQRIKQQAAKLAPTAQNNAPPSDELHRTN